MNPRKNGARLLACCIATTTITGIGLVDASASPAARIERVPHCKGERATIVVPDHPDDPIIDVRGTPGRDVIVGTELIEYVYGLGGNDLICGRTGADWLYGGEGRDTLVGGEEIGTGFGGIGDRLTGGPGDDLLVGDINGGHADPIEDLAMYDHETAPITADLAAGTVVTSANGTDTVAVEGIQGTPFDDTILGDDFSNSLFGGAGDDELSGLGENDWLIGGPGDDSASGGDGDDYFNDPGGVASINAGAGSDRVYTALRNGLIDLGPGDDLYYCGKSRLWPAIDGGEGVDTVELCGEEVDFDFGTGNLMRTFGIHDLPSAAWNFENVRAFTPELRVTGSEAPERVELSGTGIKGEVTHTVLRLGGGDDEAVMPEPWNGRGLRVLFDGGDGSDTASLEGFHDRCIAVEQADGCEVAEPAAAR